MCDELIVCLVLIDLAGAYRALSVDVIKTDMPGGEKLLEASEEVQKIHNALLKPLATANLASLVFPSGEAAGMLDDELRTARACTSHSIRADHTGSTR